MKNVFYTLLIVIQMVSYGSSLNSVHEETISK